MEPDRDQPNAEPEDGYPEEYQMHMHDTYAFLLRAFAVSIAILATCVIVTVRKEGVIVYVASYTILGLVLLACVYWLCQVKRSEITVKGTRITQHFLFARPKTYDMRDITKVYVCRYRGGMVFTIYAGKKKLFELDSDMVNHELFLQTLQRSHVRFTGEI